MPGTDAILPDDWFARGDEDAVAAAILLGQDGLRHVTAFHLQQAAEKYLI